MNNKRGSKPIGTIYETDDYSIFRRLQTNRAVEEKRVEKLLASISEKSINVPILVNEFMEIIDGQGRFEARKRLGLPITYYIVRGLREKDCIRLNKYNEKWRDRDYAVAFANGGNSNYERFLKAIDDSGVSLSTVLRLTNKSNITKNNGYRLDTYHEGQMVFTEDDYCKVLFIKKAVDEIKEALDYNHRINLQFIVSVSIITSMDHYDHSWMIKNCMVKRSSFVQASNITDQLKEFERIYNYRRSTDKRLYFSDYMRNKGANIRDYSKSKIVQEHTDVSTLRRRKHT